jgi:hypothetical protein
MPGPKACESTTFPALLCFPEKTVKEPNPNLVGTTPAKTRTYCEQEVRLLESSPLPEGVS